MDEAFPTIERLRLPKSFQAYKRPSISNKKAVKSEFLKGPIPLDWLGKASQLPGKSALAVALAIWFEVGRRKSNEIVLTKAICSRFAIDRKAKYRGLENLEGAGLVEVRREKKKNPMVKVIEASAAENNTEHNLGRIIS